MTRIVVQTDRPICLSCKRKLTDEEMASLEEVTLPGKDLKVLKGSCSEGHAVYVHLSPSKAEG